MTKSFTVFQDVELSFTENLIPTHIPVKQYDNQARKVRCRLYQNSLEYKVSKDTIVSYSATRPDGAVFQYSSETRPDLVFVDDGAVILTVTSFMTEVYGRFPIDIYLLSDEGDVIGSFSLVLNVARAAVKNGKIATLTAVQQEQQKGVLDIAEDNSVRSFREKKASDGALINAGYMVLEPQIFDYLDGDACVFEKKPLQKLAEEGQLMSYIHKGFWQCMDTAREKQTLEKMLATGNAPWKKWED